MFLCRRWRTNYWRYADRSIHLFPSRLSTCSRSPLPVSLTGAVFALLSRRQNSWWKYRRSYRTHRYAGLWSRTWTFQLLLVVVASVVVFSVYSQDRVQQHLVEQIIVQGLPSKSLTFQLRVVAKIFLLQRRLPVCRVRQIMGCFALFPVGKKCALGLALEVGTAPRVEPIHAGGSAGGFLHGCSWSVDAFSQWQVETSGLGPRSLAAGVKAGTWPLSCVSLRLLLEEFLRVSCPLCSRSSHLESGTLFLRVLASGSLCSGCLGVALCTKIGFFGR